MVRQARQCSAAGIYYAILHGIDRVVIFRDNDDHLMFYLLLLGILRTDKLSQRDLTDSFSSPLFRTLFNFNGPAISRSSISDRLLTMNLDFFR